MIERWTRSPARTAPVIRPLAGGAGAGGGERAVAPAFVVEEPPEARTGVEAGYAAPVDRPGVRDERGAVAVADQGVVGDRGLAQGPAPRLRRRAGAPPPARPDRRIPA